MTVLRPGLLDGVRVAAVATTAPAVVERLVALGAGVEDVTPLVGLDDEAAQALVAERAGFDALIVDAADGFGDGGRDGLRNALDAVWMTVRAVAVGALIPGSGGTVVLIAPADTDPFATAARDALENLARTLSIEWARYGITLTAVCPARDTAAADLAEVVAYLVSEAGRYFSGGRLELGLAAATARDRR
jgi:NAD(P)-dependent dehydrogenase (short-subunit alcohol dehydrogenase family)